VNALYEEDSSLLHSYQLFQIGEEFALMEDEEESNLNKDEWLIPV
jgi:hypothetical protein